MYLCERLCGGFLLLLLIALARTGLMLCAVVSLGSIEIFKTHEWLKVTSTVYFLCKGDNRTVLPDVKKARVSYAFTGEESWQVPYYMPLLSPIYNFALINCFYHDLTEK